MKIRLHYALLLTLAIAFGAADKAVAQDAGMSDVDILKERDRAESEKFGASSGEAEVRYIPHAPDVLKDSVASPGTEIPALKTAKPADKQQKQPDDSILSFNFLYYIIQKYKLQDIVD
jgi:hypothetical protein